MAKSTDWLPEGDHLLVNAAEMTGLSGDGLVAIATGQKTELWQVTVPLVRVVDTTRAGAPSNAGNLSGLSQGESLGAHLIRGVATASAPVSCAPITTN